MITWMQRHKKWLVVTIWISTIAFVGAGFVGWGSYDYGSKGGVVAKVGSREVTVDEYSQEYNNLFQEYSRLFGDSFNKELAEQMGLRDIAFRQVLEKNLLLNFADSLDLETTNEDIAKELVKYEMFLKDGQFDKDTYIKVLNQNRMSPKEFEDSLKNNILFSKVQTLFNVKANNKEIENISKLLFLEDDLKIKIIDSEKFEVEVDENELKEFWEKNKNLYQSEKIYSLDIKEYEIKASNPSEDEIKDQYDRFKSDYRFEDGKIKTLEEAREEVIFDIDEKLARKEALTLYLQLKKDEVKFDKTESFEESKLFFNEENLEKVKALKVGEVLKPILEDKKYYIVKLNELKKEEALSFDLAKSYAKIDFEKELRAKELDKESTKALENFEGDEVLAVNRESISKFPELSQEEAASFLNQLFESTNKKAVINIGTKAVVYEITASRWGKYDSAKNDSIEGLIDQIQSTELITNLLKKLETKYSIKTSIQGKE